MDIKVSDELLPLVDGIFEAGYRRRDPDIVEFLSVILGRLNRMYYGPHTTSGILEVDRLRVLMTASFDLGVAMQKGQSAEIFVRNLQTFLEREKFIRPIKDE